MKLKLVAAVSALAIPALAHAEQSGPQPAVPKPTKRMLKKIVQIITSDKVAQTNLFAQLAPHDTPACSRSADFMKPCC